ncbi:MAG: tagaturonate epimerase family protein [Candidatus Hodarchaeota archaeon]
MRLPKYSIGIGDRFGCQAEAQLQALIRAQESGTKVAVVWNKSHREHLITNTSPLDVLKKAQNAVEKLKWKGIFYIDADHIGISNVELYIDSCNYFTLDIAEFIGERAPNNEIDKFIEKYKKYIGKIYIPNIKEPLSITEKQLRFIAEEYLLAIKEAGKIYRRIEEKKGRDTFIIEISMDESNKTQPPIEMFFILAGIADEKIPIQTIAPKFYGEFNKGVDFKGDIRRFSKEFETFLAIIQFTKREFSLPDTLKLSIHSGSDKFSIYEAINKAIKKFNTGVHLKTSGTTWLEEVTGLAMAGGEGLEIAKEIYIKAYNRFDELCAPYNMVIDINRKKLPSPEIIKNWTNDQYVRALQHDLSSKDYNPNFRQLLHIGYKIAAEMGSRYINVLKKYNEIIAPNVTENIYRKHIKKLFL